jgi:predicted ABC-class ATPase
LDGRVKPGHDIANGMRTLRLVFLSGAPSDEWGSVAGALRSRRMSQRKADSMKARPSGNSKTLALLAMLGVAGPLEAQADILWNWSYLNPDTKITASGTLTTEDQAAGSYGITSITGVWNGAAITGLETNIPAARLQGGTTMCWSMAVPSLVRAASRLA